MLKPSKKSILQEQEKQRKEQIRLQIQEQEQVTKAEQDAEILKPYEDNKQTILSEIRRVESEDELRNNMTGKECLEILKEVCDSVSNLPRIKVLEAIQTDEDLKNDLEDLKEKAKIVFMTIPPTDKIRQSVISLFKITFGVDLELPYVEDKRNYKGKDKEVKFDDKIEVIDEERQALLAKLKKPLKKV